MSIDIASKIDHTLLKIGVDLNQLNKFIEEGVKYNVRALVVSPTNVNYLKEYLEKFNADIRVVSVVAFPYGETFTRVKICEIDHLYDIGVDEVDIVLNTSLLIQGYIDDFKAELKTLNDYIRGNYPNLTAKYIVEIPLLNKPLIVKAVEIFNEVMPEYLKTSTGYGPRGTTVDDVKFIRKILNPEIKIKAAGGIRSYQQAIELIAAGADIIGSSSGVKIIKEAVRDG